MGLSDFIQDVREFVRVVREPAPGYRPGAQQVKLNPSLSRLQNNEQLAPRRDLTEARTPTASEAGEAYSRLEGVRLLAPAERNRALGTMYRYYPSLEIGRKLGVVSPELGEASRRVAERVLNRKPTPAEVTAIDPVVVEKLSRAIESMSASKTGKRGPELRALVKAIEEATDDVGLREKLAEAALEKLRALDQPEALALPRTALRVEPAPNPLAGISAGTQPIEAKLFRGILNAFMPADILSDDTAKQLGLGGSGKDMLCKLFAGAYDRLPPLQRILLAADTFDLFKAGHADSSAIAKTLLNRLGPGFIKLMQVISSRPELVPDATQRAALAKTCDEALRVSFAEFRATAEAQLGRPLNEVFTRIDPTPLGTGSLGQVHRAWLRNGREVAIKIVKPGADIALVDNMQYLDEFFAKEAPNASALRALIGEIRRGAPSEIDLTLESQATEVAQLLNRDRSPEDMVIIPTVLFAKQHLLVTSFVAASKFDVAHITEAKSMLRSVLTQIFEDGFFHGDPNAGNALRGLKRNIFLDWGLYGVMKEHREAFRDLANHYVSDPSNVMALAADLQKLCTRMDPAKVMSVMQTPGGFAEKIDALTKIDIGLEPSVVLAIKSLIQAEGTVKNIDPNFSLEDFLRDYFGKVAVGAANSDRVPRALRRAQMPPALRAVTGN